MIIVVIVVDAYFCAGDRASWPRERCPDESTRGLTFYAVMRALQLRRFRTPAPRLKPGDKF